MSNDFDCSSDIEMLYLAYNGAISRLKATIGFFGGDMSQNYKVGDTVQLKSGGPVMTVTEVGEDYGARKVWCTWFTDKGDEKNSSFPIDAVRPIAI